MLNTRVEKYNLRGLRNYGQNSPEISEKKKRIFWTVVLVFEYKQVVFCGLQEDYSSFCTIKKVVIKLFNL